MNSPRIWILILALVSFLAGAAAGLVGGEYLDRDSSGQRADEEFVWRFAREFDLDPEGRRLLGALLASYNSEIEQIQLTHETRLDAEEHAMMEPQLLEAGKRFRADVRDMLLLTEAQRAKFDDMLLLTEGSRLESDRQLAEHTENF